MFALWHRDASQQQQNGHYRADYGKGVPNFAVNGCSRVQAHSIGEKPLLQLAMLGFVRQRARKGLLLDNAVGPDEGADSRVDGTDDAGAVFDGAELAYHKMLDQL